MIPLVRVASMLAIILCIAVARTRPRHRPIVWALLLALVASVLRTELRGVPSDASRRLSLVLLLASPIAGAWASAAALRAIPWPGLATLLVGAPLAAAAWLAPYAAAWPLAVTWAHLAGLAAQVAAIASWARRGEPATVTERTLLVLLAGDVAAGVAPIVLGGPWALAQLVALAVAVGVCAVQVAELRR